MSSANIVQKISELEVVAVIRADDVTTLKHIVDALLEGSISALEITMPCALEMSEAYTEDALEFTVAASCLKQPLRSDFNLVSVEEVRKLAKASGS